MDSQNVTLTKTAPWWAKWVIGGVLSVVALYLLSLVISKFTTAAGLTQPAASSSTTPITYTQAQTNAAVKAKPATTGCLVSGLVFGPIGGLSCIIGNKL